MTFVIASSTGENMPACRGQYDPQGDTSSQPQWGQWWLWMYGCCGRNKLQVKVSKCWIKTKLYVEVLRSNANCLNSESGAQLLLLLLPRKVAGLLEDISWISGFHCGFVGAHFFWSRASEGVLKEWSGGGLGALSLLPLLGNTHLCHASPPSLLRSPRPESHPAGATVTKRGGFQPPSAPDDAPLLAALSSKAPYRFPWC